MGETMNTIDIKCKWCNRTLNLKQVETFVGEIICTNSACRGGTAVKIVSNNPYLTKEITERLPKDRQPKEEKK